MLSRLALSCSLFIPVFAHAEVPKVATDVAAVHSLAAIVMEGLGTPELIMRPGASPHGYSMRPSEAAALDDADVVIFIGGGLTPWLDGPLETLAGDAQHLSLLGLAETTKHKARETALFGKEEDHADGDDHGDEHGHDDDHGDDHTDDHGHDDEHGDDHADGHGHDDEHGDEHGRDGHHGHAHSLGGIDPHAWLDPKNAIVWLRNIAEVMAGQDPENANLYRNNADKGIRAIYDAVAQAETLLEPHHDAQFVVFHDAYQYFEKRFGLSPAGAIALSDAVAPSPARLAKLRAALAEQNVTCVFTEPQFNPGLIEAVTGEGAFNTAELDPTGAATPVGPGFYVALITGMAETMAECL